DATGELCLVAGETPARVGGAAAFLVETLGLVGNPPLRVRDLLRLELEIAERAPLRVGGSILHLRLGAAQLPRRFLALRRGAGGVGALPLGRRVAHLLHRAVQLLLRLLRSLRALRSLGAARSLLLLLLLLQLLRGFLRLAAQLFLLARQLLELPPHLLGGNGESRQLPDLPPHLLGGKVSPGQLLLLPRQFLLPLREIADLVERAALLLLLIR